MDEMTASAISLALTCLCLPVILYMYYLYHLFFHWWLFRSAWGRNIAMSAIERDPKSRERLYNILREESARRKGQPTGSRRMPPLE